MSVLIKSSEKWGTLFRTYYSDDEIEKAWADHSGQGNRQSREKGRFCHLRTCNKETAIILCRLFLDEFNLPTCCFYDGYVLSLYCGDSGRSHKLQEYMERFVIQ